MKINEFKRKLKSWRWRMNNLYSIMDKDGNKIQFKMNRVQQDLFDNLHYRNVVLKARQFGISTFSCIFALDKILFTPNQRTAIIAQNARIAEGMFRDKVKYAYDCLPEIVRKERPILKDTGSELILSHNGTDPKSWDGSSGVEVTASARGGTKQFLHISEFGKICANDKKQAREIVAGSLNTLGQESICIIESTAEGSSGQFYDISMKALDKVYAKETLSRLDYKMFFFPWFDMEDYTLDDENVVVTDEDEDYFESLLDVEEHDCYALKAPLTMGQKRWYVKTREIQDEDMYQEFPSNPQESFKKILKGAYYASRLRKIMSAGQVSNDIKYDPLYTVNTAWDIGTYDETVIWFYQVIKGKYVFIDYYENTDNGVGHYIDVIRDKGFGSGLNYVPWDSEKKNFDTGMTTTAFALKHYGFRLIPVDRVAVLDGINMCRNLITNCYFSKEVTSKGFTALQNYKKTWNKSLECFSKEPCHDEYSHASDAFRTFALAVNGESASSFSDSALEGCLL